MCQLHDEMMDLTLTSAACRQWLDTEAELALQRKQLLKGTRGVLTVS